MVSMWIVGMGWLRIGELIVSDLVLQVKAGDGEMPLGVTIFAEENVFGGRPGGALVADVEMEINGGLLGAICAKRACG